MGVKKVAVDSVEDDVRVASLKAAEIDEDVDGEAEPFEMFVVQQVTISVLIGKNENGDVVQLDTPSGYLISIDGTVGSEQALALVSSAQTLLADRVAGSLLPGNLDYDPVSDPSDEDDSNDEPDLSDEEDEPEDEDDGSDESD